MRINEFNNLQEFIDEYDFLSTKDCEKHIGIEFVYKDTNYRVCCEPLDDAQLPILANGRKGRYDVNIINWENDTQFEYELVGWYADMNDLLENCMIGDRKFKDVIIDDETRITGKD